MALRNAARPAFLQGNRAGPGGRPCSSRADLAKKAGVTEALCLDDRERHAQASVASALTRLARALGVPVTELLE